MKKSSIILIVIGILIVLFGSILIGSYNKMVTSKENVTTSYSNLDVMLQRRADLIPNLVNTVKGYTSHENEVIDKITKAQYVTTTIFRSLVITLSNFSLPLKNKYLHKIYVQSTTTNPKTKYL